MSNCSNLSHSRIVSFVTCFTTDLSHPLPFSPLSREVSHHRPVSLPTLLLGGDTPCRCDGRDEVRSKPFLVCLHFWVTSLFHLTHLGWAGRGGAGHVTSQSPGQHLSGLGSPAGGDGGSRVTPAGLWVPPHPSHIKR